MFFFADSKIIPIFAIGYKSRTIVPHRASVIAQHKSQGFFYALTISYWRLPFRKLLLLLAEKS